MTIPSPARLRILCIVAAIAAFSLAIAPFLVLSFHPDGLGLIIEFFHADDLDAPDNWAVAFERSVYFFLTFTLIGCLFSIAAFCIPIDRKGEAGAMVLK